MEQKEVSWHCRPSSCGSINILLPWARENTGQTDQSDLTVAHAVGPLLALGDKGWILYRLAWGCLCFSP